MAALFSWPGISATISRRILTFTEDKIGKNDDESYYSWLMGEFGHKLMIDDYDLSHIDMASFNTLTEKMLRVGAFFEVIHTVTMFGFFFIKRGDFEKAGIWQGCWVVSVQNTNTIMQRYISYYSKYDYP